jgi:hypothetical protein
MPFLFEHLQGKNDIMRRERALQPSPKEFGGNLGGKLG